MNHEQIPIVCTLNDAEFRERERDVLQKIKAYVLEMSETGDGYSFRFPSDDASLATLNEFVHLERRCCPFLDFNLTVPRGEGDIHLDLSGLDGAKEFVAATFLP